MARVQLALNVDDIGAAVAFYSKLFATEPAKIRDGYANFAIVDPPLKLVLIENPGGPSPLNHVGVEVADTDAVAAHAARVAASGLRADVEKNAQCCYATQDKVWVSGETEIPWEIYTVLGDSPIFCDVDHATGATAEQPCCATC